MNSVPQKQLIEGAQRVAGSETYTLRHTNNFKRVSSLIDFNGTTHMVKFFAGLGLAASQVLLTIMDLPPTQHAMGV